MAGNNAITAAWIGLAGALGAALITAIFSWQSYTPTQQEKTADTVIEQNTAGNNSPAISHVKGNVIIIADQPETLNKPE